MLCPGPHIRVILGATSRAGRSHLLSLNQPQWPRLDNRSMPDFAGSMTPKSLRKGGTRPVTQKLLSPNAPRFGKVISYLRVVRVHNLIVLSRLLVANSLPFGAKTTHVMGPSCAL